jgi:hypothetical protein
MKLHAYAREHHAEFTILVFDHTTITFVGDLIRFQTRDGIVEHNNTENVYESSCAFIAAALLAHDAQARVGVRFTTLYHMFRSDDDWLARGSSTQIDLPSMLSVRSTFRFAEPTFRFAETTSEPIAETKQKQHVDLANRRSLEVSLSALRRYIDFDMAPDFDIRID